MHIKIDDVTGTEIQELLRDHLYNMTLHSPPESIHALDIEALQKPEITFWSAWEGNELLGCGALKQLDLRHGEVKSMKTADKHLRKGVAATLLNHIIETAKQRGYQRLSLETGSMAAFKPACFLYERFGFDYCKPFADYKQDPYSLFMTKIMRP